MLLDGANLWYQVNGSWNWSGISIGELGSDPHRITFTWDNATGTYAHYMDGVEQRSGSGFLAGATLNGNGSGNVVFNPVNGAIGDIRLYDRAITASEVTTNHRGPLPDPANTDGLRLNWVVGANGNVTDATGGTAPQVVAGSGAAPVAVLPSSTPTAISP